MKRNELRTWVFGCGVLLLLASLATLWQGYQEPAVMGDYLVERREAHILLNWGLATDAAALGLCFAGRGVWRIVTVPAASLLLWYWLFMEVLWSGSH